MDRDTIINFTVNASQDVLAKIVSLIYKKVFHYQNANTDRTGNSGRDILLFTWQGHSQLNIAFQLTTQKERIERKAVEDTKVKDYLHVNSFIFVCTKSLLQTTIQNISFAINVEVGIQATYLGAIELASLIIDNDLDSDFFDIVISNKKFTNGVLSVPENIQHYKKSRFFYNKIR